MRRLILGACALVALAAPPVLAHGPASGDLPGPRWDLMAPAPGPSLTTLLKPTLPAPAPAMPGRFVLLGHSPLLSRGMNAALAVGDGYAYVGSRTDASQLNSEVLVVDVRTPSAPAVVGKLPRAGLGETSRELRVIPHAGLLVVLYHGCSELIHRCVNLTQAGVNLAKSRYAFYDITGANARAPKLVGTYVPSRGEPQTPHEFFVWSDPERPGRTLLYQTTPSSESSEKAQLLVSDVSRAREDVFTELATWSTVVGHPERDNRLHSLTVTPDGRRAMLAYLGGGFLVADTSDFADAVADPEVRLVTPVANRVFWTDPGAHSAIKVPGKPFVLTTDEVYGKLGGVLAAHGCPWGWVRLIDIADETAPRLASQYKIPSNTCDGVSLPRNNFSSFASHNPTLTQDLALVTWHSAGLQVIDLADPTRPRPAAQFLPTPLPLVMTEDPALSSGVDKVVMWSFPVVRDGLIYVVDLRNGLYVLRYEGPHAAQVRDARYLDGNSNSEVF